MAGIDEHVMRGKMSSKEIKVTKPMIRAALKELRESGALYSEWSAGELLVRDILDAALAAGRSNVESPHKARTA